MTSFFPTNHIQKTLKKLQFLFDRNSIKSNEKINLNLLKKIKIINKKFNKFKLLGSGNINFSLDIEADYISKSAKEKIEIAVGKIKLIKAL